MNFSSQILLTEKNIEFLKRQNNLQKEFYYTAQQDKQQGRLNRWNKIQKNNRSSIFKMNYQIKRNFFENQLKVDMIVYINQIDKKAQIKSAQSKQNAQS